MYSYIYLFSRRYFEQKYKRMLVKQMLTESEAYMFTYMITLKTFKIEVYEKTSNELFNLISLYINNDIMERYRIYNFRIFIIM